MSANTAQEQTMSVAANVRRRGACFQDVHQAGATAAQARSAVDRVKAANPPSSPAAATRRPVGLRPARRRNSAHAARSGMHNDSVDGDATSGANLPYATRAPHANAAGQISSPPISTAI